MQKLGKKRASLVDIAESFKSRGMWSASNAYLNSVHFYVLFCYSENENVGVMGLRQKHRIYENVPPPPPRVDVYHQESSPNENVARQRLPPLPPPRVDVDGQRRRHRRREARRGAVRAAADLHLAVTEGEGRRFPCDEGHQATPAAQEKGQERGQDPPSIKHLA
jgi:hypothetical protein